MDRMTRRVFVLSGSLVLAATAACVYGVHSLIRVIPRDMLWHGEHYSILSPQMLYIVAVAPLLFWVASRSLADLPRIQRFIATFIRVLIFAFLALALSRPARTTDSQRVSTVYLVDVSDSVTNESLDDARQSVQQAWTARGENDVQLVTFARHPRVVPLDADTNEVPAITRPSAGTGAGSSAGDQSSAMTATQGSGTNLQAALQLAYGLYPAGYLRRAVIISDGGQTDGDLLAEASRARAFGTRLFYTPYRRGAPREVALRALTVPDRIEVGEPFFVRARVFSSTDTRARVRLYQGETLNGLDSIREVDLHRGDTDLEFRSVVRVAGPITYTLDIEPTGADRFRANNRFAVSTIVPGRPTVLYVESDPSRALYLARALTAGDYEVEVRSPREIPQSLRELERFDFFILSDVAADQVSLTQMDMIERYVRDLGGGFIMAGGEAGFGLGGWQHTRIEQLLPVRMDAERRRDQPSLALALVIDKSGSMSGTKMELAKDAAKATAELLGAEDYIEVVGFDSSPTRVVRMQSAANRIRILTDIGRLTANGGTAILPALDMAFQDLSVTRARVKHVILLTDGQTQETGFETLVQAMRAEGITLSTVGLGGDVNRALLTAAANLGGGRAYFTTDPHNVPRIFMRETSTVQRSSAVEEYFQPQIVTQADFLRGLDVGRAPFLHGYVATQAKPDPVQVILQSELGEPILARWRVGLGWALAWTSDVKNRWAVEWLRWPGFQPFWSQLVREHMRQRRRQTLDMRAEILDGEVRVAVDAIGQDDQFLNGLDSELTIDGPMGARAGRGAGDAAIHATHPLRQVAPGRYEARFPLDRYGSFVMTATHRRDGRPVAESIAQISNPYPREYGTLEPDETLMRRAASVTGGFGNPTPQQVFDPNGEKIRRHEDLWSKFLYAALVAFLIDLLLRRIRLFDRKFKAAPSRR
ncbi:MAG: VWA domain-containing protein [Sandaracinaceae bacterium]|nr:VWA domain-containing protein [Sandaracinaceae bacterium]